jgi:hypothetical protein
VYLSLVHIICNPNKLCKLSIILSPRLIRSYWDCCNARSLPLMVCVIHCAHILPLLVAVPRSYLIPLCQPLHTSCLSLLVSPFPLHTFVLSFVSSLRRFCLGLLKLVPSFLFFLFFPVCMHSSGQSSSPVKVGNCTDSRKRMDALIEEHVERTPQATHSKIVLKASKDLVGEFLLPNDSDPDGLPVP